MNKKILLYSAYKQIETLQNMLKRISQVMQLSRQFKKKNIISTNSRYNFKTKNNTSDNTKYGIYSSRQANIGVMTNGTQRAL